MFNNVIGKIRKINENHPYLMSTLIFVVASSIGICVQYWINGRIIGAGFYTASFIAIADIIAKWVKRDV